MSCSPPSAWITEPEPRNSSALKNACVMRWKMPARERADAHRQEHVAELRDRRVREHPLDVVLHEADRAGHQRGRGADRPRRSPASSARARTARRCGRSCRRRPSPSSPRGSARRPASGRPSRPAARRTAESARTCRSRRRTAAASIGDSTPNARLERAARDRGARPAGSRACRTSTKIRNIAEQEAEVADAVDDERLLAGVGALTSS